MKEFTVINIFKCWLKIWPITIILVALGAGVGSFNIKQPAPEYTAELAVLIVDNRDGSSAEEYAGLVDSDIVAEPTLREAAVGDGCKIAAAGRGDKLIYTATCPTTEEEAARLVTVAAKNFEAWAQDIYGKENFRTVQLSKEAAVTASSNNEKRISKVVVPAAIMLAVSFVIAFVYLDFKVSKGHGKKS